MYKELLIIVALSTAGLSSILDGDLDKTEGIKLVSKPVSNSLDDEGKGFDGNSPVFRIAKLLQGHELRVKLPDLIEDKMRRIFEKLLKTVDEMYKDIAVTGRGSVMSTLYTLMMAPMIMMMVPVAIVGLGFANLKMLFDSLYQIKNNGL